MRGHVAPTAPLVLSKRVLEFQVHSVGQNAPTPHTLRVHNSRWTVVLTVSIRAD